MNVLGDTRSVQHTDTQLGAAHDISGLGRRSPAHKPSMSGCVGLHRIQRLSSILHAVLLFAVLLPISISGYTPLPGNMLQVLNMALHVEASLLT